MGLVLLLVQALAAAAAEEETVFRSGPTFGAAMARVRQWAHGLGDPRACAERVCPAIDRFEQQVFEGDLDGANAALGPLREAVRAAVPDPCERAAGLSAVNGLECEVNPVERVGHDPIFCVTRTDDVAPRIPAPTLEECSDEICASDRAMSGLRGTFRWAVCQANRLPDDGRRPRIHFAPELASCVDGRPRFAPIRLQRVTTRIYRNGTVIDGYTLPGATPGNALERRAPTGLPVLSGADLPRAGESITPLVAITANDVTLRGLELRDDRGESPLVLRPEGAWKGACPYAGKRNWIAGNLFTDNDTGSIFVEIPEPRGRRGPGSYDIRDNVIGMRAERPDPADGNVFRGRGETRVTLAAGLDRAKRGRFGTARDNALRGNYLVAPPLGSSARALWLNASEGTRVECNLFEGGGAGVVADGAFGTLVSGNRFLQVMRPVIGLHGAGGLVIGRLDPPPGATGLDCVPGELGGGNLIARPEVGVELVGRVRGARVERNRVEHARGAGIQVGAGDDGAPRDVEVIGNEVRESFQGVRIDGGRATVLANELVGNAGEGIVLRASRRPRWPARARLGSEERPNRIRGNGGAGIVIDEARATNEDTLERDNEIAGNGLHRVVKGWRALVEVRMGAAPVRGATVRLRGADAGVFAVEALSDAQGIAGPPGFDVHDAGTWWFVPQWVVDDARRELGPTRVSVVREGPTVELEVDIDGVPHGAREADFGLPSGRCVDLDGERCAAGGFLERVIEVELPSPAPAAP